MDFNPLCVAGVLSHAGAAEPRQPNAEAGLDLQPVRREQGRGGLPRRPGGDHGLGNSNDNIKKISDVVFLPLLQVFSINGDRDSSEVRAQVRGRVQEVGLIYLSLYII